MNFKVNDQVYIKDSCYRYNGALRGLTGRICNIFSNAHNGLGVLIPNMVNQNSREGYFWLAEYDLAPVLIKDDLVPSKEASFAYPTIKNVYFNKPYTIVIWSDKVKTIVKTSDNDIYDPEKGLAMAVSKRFLGSNESGSNYYDIFKKWLPEEEEKKTSLAEAMRSFKERLNENLSKLTGRLPPKIECENCRYDEECAFCGEHCEPCKDYSNFVPKVMGEKNDSIDEPKGSKTESQERNCITCKYEKLTPDQYPCSNCKFPFSRWEGKDVSAATCYESDNNKPEYNPVAKAYDILVKFRDDDTDVDLDIDDIIDYLDEALK